ncbi:MAG: metalloregulator ArsR/SmtB family transcription factor [Microbacteriaceae bacterium]
MVTASETPAVELPAALSAGSAGRVARSSQALADPTRVRLVSLILASEDGRAYVSELAEKLGVTQPTASHHVRKLREEGILERDFLGRRAWYSVAPVRLDDVTQALSSAVGAVVTRVSPFVLERISADLAGRFRGIFSPETVARYVQESHALLAEEARITRYLPSLTARFAADRLTALARADVRYGGSDRSASAVPEVLFVCVQNAGRSQMAAAILRTLAGDAVSVRTAGSAPAEAVHPSVIVALDEIGVSLGGEFPKPLTDEVVRAADVVITMGCGDACPVYPGRRYLDWPLGDPLDLPLSGVRGVRDDIERRVRKLITELGVLQNP